MLRCEYCNKKNGEKSRCKKNGFRTTKERGREQLYKCLEDDCGHVFALGALSRRKNQIIDVEVYEKLDQLILQEGAIRKDNENPKRKRDGRYQKKSYELIFKILLKEFGPERAPSISTIYKRTQELGVSFYS
jgi:hypothetical protein